MINLALLSEETQRVLRTTGIDKKFLGQQNSTRSQKVMLSEEEKIKLEAIRVVKEKYEGEITKLFGALKEIDATSSQQMRRLNTQMRELETENSFYQKRESKKPKKENDQKELKSEIATLKENLQEKSNELHRSALKVEELGSEMRRIYRTRERQNKAKTSRKYEEENSKRKLETFDLKMRTFEELGQEAEAPKKLIAQKMISLQIKPKKKNSQEMQEGFIERFGEEKPRLKDVMLDSDMRAALKRKRREIHEIDRLKNEIKEMKVTSSESEDKMKETVAELIRKNETLKQVEVKIKALEMQQNRKSTKIENVLKKKWTGSVKGRRAWSRN